MITSAEARLETALAKIQTLEEALKPFAAHVETVKKAFPRDIVARGKVCRDAVSFMDFERAAIALGDA